MIIWGSVGREIELSSGEFYCPNCGIRQPYRHMRLARYFTLYFIPLFQTQNLGQHVECKACRAAFKEEVLETPQQYLGAHSKRKPRLKPTSIEIGDRVLAPWPGDSFYYPGTIRAIEKDRVEIQYTDGDMGWVAKEQLSVLDVSVGDRVFARWQGGKGFYAGTVNDKNGDAIFIIYDDGDEEWTTLTTVRVERTVEIEAQPAELDTRITKAEN